MKLKYCPYGQAHVKTVNDGIILYSYVTAILKVDNDGWVIPIGPVTCSATTRKHVGCFMKEYCAPLGYHDAKAAYIGEYKINYLTGEVEEL